MVKRKRISICIPVCNEEENVPLILPTVDAALESIADVYDLEFLFTDNCSTDKTFEILSEIARNDSRVKVIRFSRNFGYQKSILQGYLRSSGDCAVQLDADLQDPPDIILKFVEEWAGGAKVVYGIRENRPESMYLSALRVIFYRLLNWVSDYPVPVDAGDFRLIDREVIEVLRDSKVGGLYLRGQIARIGFRQIGIPYSRKERKFGESKFSFSRLVGLALDGIISQSIRPLRIATYLGLLFGGASVVGIGVYTIARLALNIYWPPGFATTTLLLLFSISLNALLLGVIGEYIGRIYRNIIQQDKVIEELRINIERFDGRS